MSKNLSKRVVGASVLAVAIGMAAGTSAQTLGTAAYPANTFAIELNYNSAAATPGVPLSIAPITTSLGFGVSVGQDRYIRYILSTGASFHNLLVAGELTDTNTAFAGATVVSGGTAGTSCVVYQVTGAAGGHAQTDVISFAPGAASVDVVSNAAPVTVTYTLHETATSASCTTGDNSTILNTPVAGNIATFSNSIAFTAPAVYVDTADVQFSLPPALPFGGFVAGGAPADAVSTTNAGLANISLQLASYVGLVPLTPTTATGVPVTLAQLASKSVMTITSADGGTFAATSTNNGAAPPVGTVVLQTSAACNVNAAPAWTVGLLNATDTVATYTNAAPPIPWSYWLCYSVTGKTAIPTGDYTASITLTPQANVTLETVPTIAVGTINHNGTVLQAPWFTLNSSYISRFFLTNNGTFDAPYTTTFLTESGITAAAGSGAVGHVAPGTTLEIDAASLVSLTGGTRAAVVFNIAAPNATIQGAYNVVNATTGSITVSPMIRPGTN